MPTRRVLLACALAAAAGLTRPARACTTIAVGRDASATGSAMVTHSDDSGGAADLRMVRVRARDHPPGSKRPVYLSVGTFPRLFAPERALEYGSAQLPAGLELDPALYTPLGHIAQVSHTYGYHDTDYGVANEAGLVMGESTCATKLTSLPRGHVQPDESGRLRNGSALFGIDELSRVALERCATARCAARTMGEMAVRHGFYGGAALWGGQYGRNGAPMGSAESDKWGGLENSEGGESLVLADRSGEAWVFHVSPDDTGVSAVWAAQRVPDDQVAVVANNFIIRRCAPAVVAGVPEAERPPKHAAAHEVAHEAGAHGKGVRAAADPAVPAGGRGRSPDCMRSVNARAVAERAGLIERYNPAVDGPDPLDFDFTAAFAYTPEDTTAQQVNRYYTGRRMWRVFDLLAPSLHLDPSAGHVAAEPKYPFAVRPEKKVGVRTLIEVHRDYYEGTPYDLTRGLAAGPFGTPNRYSGAPPGSMAGAWERAISMHRSLWVFVNVAGRPREVVDQDSSSPSPPAPATATPSAPPPAPPAPPMPEAARALGNGTARADTRAPANATWRAAPNGTAEGSGVLRSSSLAAAPPQSSSLAALMRPFARTELASSAPRGSGGETVVWFGADTPHASFFSPLLPALDFVPAELASTNEASFDPQGSAWWAVNAVKYLMDLNFRLMRPAVRDAQLAWEADARALGAELEGLLATGGSDDDPAADAPSVPLPIEDSGVPPRAGEPKRESLAAATVAAIAVAESVTMPVPPVGAAAAREACARLSQHWAAGVARWNALFGELMVLNRNGYQNTIVAPGVAMEGPFRYPVWWLQQVGYDRFPQPLGEEPSVPSAVLPPAPDGGAADGTDDGDGAADDSGTDDDSDADASAADASALSSASPWWHEYGVVLAGGATAGLITLVGGAMLSSVGRRRAEARSSFLQNQGQRLSGSADARVPLIGATADGVGEHPSPSAAVHDSGGGSCAAGGAYDAPPALALSAVGAGSSTGAAGAAGAGASSSPARTASPRGGGAGAGADEPAV